MPSSRGPPDDGGIHWACLRLCTCVYCVGPKAPEIGKGRSPDRGLELVFKQE